MKLFFFDLETTGVNNEIHGIHQISGEIVIDGESKESFNWFVKPHEGARIDPQALEVVRKTEEEIMSYPDMNTVYWKLIKMLSKYVQRFDKTDKFYLVGYNNASFDNQFLRSFFIRNKDKYFGSWFWANSIDVMVISTPILAPLRHSMPDYKQATVAKYLGIPVEEEKLHDASYDIFLCKEIYKRSGGVF